MFDDFCGEVKPFSFAARQAVRTYYKKATADDMVRICATNGTDVQRLHECVSESDNDIALSQAIASVSGEWIDHKVTHQDFIAYADAHGIWCVECGNSVVTATNGGHVCPMPGCSNHNAAICPTWASAFYGVAEACGF